jgi:sulfatase maturation enzyme AslB (radical SAM superfamily)
MKPLEVKWLQVENTTKCNAWCPGCSRNQQGYGLAPGLVVQDLDTERFSEILQQLSNLETIQFCGTYGDFAAASNVLEHVELALKHSKKIQIHTHGGIRNAHWWHELAGMLKHIDHDVWFAIDGLKGIHEIYRQGTDFDKTLENACAFIKSGGSATWQFIPWAHNEHQIKDCMRESQQLGFKKFKFMFGVRQGANAYHYRTGEPIELQDWSRSKTTNHWKLNKTQIQISNCSHLREKSIYVNANGTISACCFFNLNRAHGNLNDLPDLNTELTSIPQPTCIRACGSV